MNGLKSHSQSNGELDKALEYTMLSINEAFMNGQITAEQCVELHCTLLEEAIMLEIEKAQRGERT